MTLMWEEILEQPKVLEKLLRSNENTFKELISKLSGRRIDSVVIAARGTSDHAGVYGKYITEYALGIPTALAAPSIFTVYGRSMELKNSLVIGISQSGKAEDALEVLRSARASGALTVSITNDESSPLALGADYHLFCNAGLEKSVAATKTFTSELYLLAQLVANWSGNPDMKKDLAMVPGNMEKVLATGSDIKAKTERYRFIEDCFVLTRGINYAIALETALKLQETCYVRAKAYSTSDFYHGPLAMIEKDTPVIMFAPEGPALSDTAKMVERLKESMPELLIVSNSNEILGMGSTSFEIPKTSNDMVSPFYNVAVAQMFACCLALSKGLNPDAPRGLKKVTITR